MISVNIKKESAKMTSPTFEVRYCPNLQHNVCVEMTSKSGAEVTRRCLYAESSCAACKYVPEPKPEPEK